MTTVYRSTPNVSADRSNEILRLKTGGLPIQRMFRIGAWLLAIAIVVLSLSPPSARPITPAGHGFEHLLIFLATGTAFALGYTARASRLALALVMFAGAIELAQIFVPGRHARIGDFIIDAAASCFGVALAWLMLRARIAIK